MLNLWHNLFLVTTRVNRTVIDTGPTPVLIQTGVELEFWYSGISKYLQLKISVHSRNVWFFGSITLKINLCFFHYLFQEKVKNQNIRNTIRYPEFSSQSKTWYNSIKLCELLKFSSGKVWISPFQEICWIQTLFLLILKCFDFVNSSSSDSASKKVHLMEVWMRERRKNRLFRIP